MTATTTAQTVATSMSLDERARFEAWITAPPYERGNLARFSESGAWPGHYCVYDTQLAWEAWQAALAPSQDAEQVTR